MDTPRDYGAAIAALNTLQSNASVVEAIRKSGRSLNEQAIPEMRDWCRKAGRQPSDFDRLNPIHIAGTKGKGSTSAFVSSILAQYLGTSTHGAHPLNKIGLYTSPHLRFVRERIQINNEPLSEYTFASYFFDLWDRFDNAASAPAADAGVQDKRPVYFRYLTLMALHAYLQEGVDVAVVECGIGGEYDSTNIIERPAVTAVTSLGIDHTAMLGSTISEIAWHKAGIFKTGVPAFTVPQPDAALQVLRDRAAERGTTLQVVDRHPELDEFTLGLSADFQKTNASLAIAVAATCLRSRGWTDIPSAQDIHDHPLPREFRRGLEEVRCAGRCDVRREKGIAWHLDGGHTLESIELGGKWFADQLAQSSSARSAPRVLIFNQQTRDAQALARALFQTLRGPLRDSAAASKPFTHAIFCPNRTYTAAGYNPDLVSMNVDADAVSSLTIQRGLAEAWREMDSAAEVTVAPSIEEALSVARRVATSSTADGEVMALITGSLHLVGGALDVLESQRVE